MKEMAQLRMKRRGAGSRDLLTENELLEVLEMEPDLELVFTITANAGGKKGKKVSAPGVMNLQVANDFRRRLSAAARGKNSDAALKAEKRKIDQDGTKENKKRKLNERKLW